MIGEHDIKRVATHVGTEANAEPVILFGSHARGGASKLLRFKRSRELYKLFRPYPLAMDLLVYTPQEVERGKKSPVSFVSTVLREGKTLYVRRAGNSETMSG